MPGYSYNYIFMGNGYVNGTFLFGPSIQYRRFLLNESTVSEWTTEYEMRARAAIGYNGDRLIAGLTYSFQHIRSQVAQRTLTVGNNAGTFGFVVGYRLTAPKFLQKIRPSFL